MKENNLSNQFTNLIDLLFFMSKIFKFKKLCVNKTSFLLLITLIIRFMGT